MTFSNALSLSLICFSLVGCAIPIKSNTLTHTEPKSTSAERRSVSLADLAHRHFVLLSVDGKPWQPADTALPVHPRAMYPGIDFNEQNIMGSTFCNELQGHVSQENNKVQGMLTPLNYPVSAHQQKNEAIKTKICADTRLNQWDRLFQQMMSTGVVLELQESTLFIEGAGHTMTFMLRDWVY
ncbi:MAG: hypothetical protein ACRC5U_00335 [Plesiomonas sp.]